MKVVSNIGFTIRQNHEKLDEEQYPEIDLIIRSPIRKGDSIFSGELFIKGVKDVTIRTRESILTLNPDGDIDILPLDSKCLIYDSDDDSISDGYFGAVNLKG